MAAGYYAATNLAQVATNLAAGNIKTTVNVFGVVGTYTGGGGSATNAPVPKTGQTNSYATRDDGALTNGVAWPNPRFAAVALSGDETNQIRDNLTGLIWARNASNACGFASAQTNWGAAVTNCNTLNYGGTNDLRLPNVCELHGLIAWQYSLPALSDGTGTNKWTEDIGPFTGVQSDNYWSSTTYVEGTTYAWRVYLRDGASWASALRRRSRSMCGPSVAEETEDEK